MARAKFFTTQQLGPKQSLTPEGFLVIEDVPIARIGTQEYHTTEVNLPGDSRGLVRVRRDEAEVFSEKHVLSYNGKAIVDDHPENEDVNPDNYKALTVGTVLNPHRGTGLEADLLFADFVICDAAAIKAVREGKRQVSCGYDADYNEIEPGEGEQVNLVGNHVALVDAGRCGARCSIQDRRPIPTGDHDMRVRTLDKKPAWLDKFMKAQDKFIKAVRDEDPTAEAAAKKDMDDAMLEAGDPAAAAGGEEHTHVHVHQDGAAEPGASAGINGEGPTRMTDDEIRGGFAGLQDTMERMAGTMDAIAAHVGYKADDSQATEEIEGQLEEEAPQGTGDKARKARDSIYLGDSYQESVALAEILVPGVRVPEFTRDAAPKKTFDAICSLRRNTLDLLNNQAEGRGLIEQVHGKVLTLDGMKCGDVRVLFRAVGALKKQMNRDGSRSQSTVTRQEATGGRTRYATLDMESQVTAFYADKKKAA